MKAKQRPENTRPVNSRFDGFVSEIVEGNVLLLVGRRFASNPSVFNGKDIYDYLLEELNAEFDTSASDFSSLLHEPNFIERCCEDPDLSRYLRGRLYEILDSNVYEVSDVNPQLLSLIQTGYFRFVFTVTFDPLLEEAMRNHFKNLRVMNFFDTANRDITTQDEFNTPTLYYLFGKADPYRMFVATDNDALIALHRWHTLMSDSTLIRYASEKYILTLGCDHDDWLFRFIWFMLKGNSGSPERLSKGLVADYAKSDSLELYLRRNRILIDNDSNDVSRRILASLNAQAQRKWELPAKRADVFISYSRQDNHVADKLYDALTSKGLSVWYDKYDLAGTVGGRFMDLIRESIETSEIFIAILSPTITNQANDAHVYRKEWYWAKELKYQLVAGGNCFAAISGNYDIAERKSVQKDDCEWLAELDNYIYEYDNPDFDAWADAINEKVFRIKRARNERR